MGMGMRWTINGRTFEMTDVARDERIRLGDAEVWEFVNQGMGAGMMGGMMVLALFSTLTSILSLREGEEVKILLWMLVSTFSCTFFNQKII